MRIRLIPILAVILALGAISTTRQASALELARVTANVYAIVGDLDQRTPQNFGNNATFGFVVTEEGVVLMDPGGSYKGAAQIANLIKSVTDKPVTHVINTGGQDHRWLGNGYFKERGATIIASQAADADHKARANDQFFVLRNLIGEEGLAGTKDVYADQTFANALDLNVGGVRLELRHVAAAHTPGDSFVWLPAQGVVFTGDIVYVGRMLGVMPHSSSKTWLDAFAAIEALRPTYLVPGHGPVTDMVRAQAETRDYLVMLRTRIADVIKAGGGINEATAIDQSAFSHLAVYGQIKGRNAQQVFEQMEWED